MTGKVYQVSNCPGLSYNRVGETVDSASETETEMAITDEGLTQRAALQHFDTPEPIFLAAVPVDRLHPDRKAISKMENRYFISFVFLDQN